MRPEEAILALWAATPAVTAVLGSAPLRAWPEQGPDDGSAVYPRVIYGVQGEDKDHALSGTSTNKQARIEVECQGYGAAGYDDARGLAEKLLAAVGAGSRALEDWGPAFMPSAAASTKLWVQSVMAGEVRLGQPEQPLSGAARPITKAVFDLTIAYLAG